MKILIDIDDTISNFAEVLIKWLNQENNTNYKKEEINGWNWFTNHFSNPWNPTKYKSFWNEIKINEDAVYYIEKLVKDGDEVYIVTASFPSDTLGHKIRKTLSNFNESLINKDNIIICYNKGMIKGDIRIDDGVHNLYEDSINILYSQPWNKNVISSLKYKRLNNWKDIYNYIITLK